MVVNSYQRYCFFIPFVLNRPVGSDCVGRLGDTKNPSFRCFDRRLLEYSASGLPSILVDCLRYLEGSVLLLLNSSCFHIATLTAVGTEVALAEQ